MPVDLSAIPSVARRRKKPSLKAWLLALLIIFLSGVFITLKLWPAEVATRGAFFWHCLVSAPVIGWLTLLSIRWLVWLVSEWQADGWDSERAADIAAEVYRGQRFLEVKAISIRLPHVVASEGVAEQFLLPQAVILPVVVDQTTQSVANQACFDDAAQPVADRVLRSLLSLVEDLILKEELLQRKSRKIFSTVIQIDTDYELLSEDILKIKDKLTQLYIGFSRVKFSPHFSWEDIDALMDEQQDMDGLLLLSVRILRTPSDGDGEAAVALLFKGMSKDREFNKPFVRLHRPETVQNFNKSFEAVKQSIMWGNILEKDISHLWLAGLGRDNKAKNFIASNCPEIIQVNTNDTFIDIDMKSGHTGKVSPWLAVALAADSSLGFLSPQLVMSIPDHSGVSWWMVIQAG
ncbi:hypothetical protein [Erwinia sorbitola]|uniref:Type VI secretion protein n=1 Tax=Erwinia sorbitola TaxID=2681984 RepID=A0ABW9RHC9_9GAMM|nr:hypothetical protein [Erwinia sorbitola]MTD29393.1 hypothetical protein [Erwinia sorbitola]